MKVSFVLLAAVLAFTASAAPLDRRSRPATTADLANVDAAPAVGSSVYAREATPEVYVELSKRQDSNALKNLVVNYLQQNKTPQIIIDLIKTAPDAVVAKIMKLPPKDLQTVVDQLKSGKIPTIPGITPKELVVGFLTPLNIPATTMGYITEAPESMFERITNLPLAQLEAVINDLKGGRIPTIAGVTDGLPGVGATTPGASAPAQIAPVASTPVTPPVVSAPAPIPPVASAAAPIAQPVVAPMVPVASPAVAGDSGLASPAAPKRQKRQDYPGYYPPTTGAYPPVAAAAAYPPAAAAYPPATGAYPPATGAYPPATGAYPPAVGANGQTNQSGDSGLASPAAPKRQKRQDYPGYYPPTTGAYPPVAAAAAYPPAAAAYPPATGAYPPATGAYPPATGAYPPAVGANGQTNQSGDSGLASPARPKAKRQAATTPITPAAGTNPVGTAPNPNAQAAAPAVDFPTSGAQFQQLMVSDMTNGGADPKQIAFIKTVPTATFDKILALEKQAGGQGGQPPNQDVIAKLDSVYGQLFNLQMPNFDATAAAPVTGTPANTMPAANPVGGTPVGGTPVGGTPVGGTPAGSSAAAPVASAPAMPAANTPMGSTPVGTAQPVTAGDSGLASPAAPKRQ